MARPPSAGDDRLLQLVEEIARDVSDMVRSQASARGGAALASASGGKGGANNFRGASSGGSVSLSGAGNITRGLSGLLGGGLAAVAAGGAAGIAAQAATNIARNVVGTAASETVNGVVNTGLNFSDAFNFGVAKGVSKIPFVGGRVASDLSAVERAGSRVKGILTPLARAGADPNVLAQARIPLFARFAAQEFRSDVENRAIDRLVQGPGTDIALGNTARRAAGDIGLIPQGFAGPPSEKLILDSLKASSRGQYRRGSE